MTRSVPEWIGKTDDAAIPPRVKWRVLERFTHQCQRCTLPMRARSPEFDHIIALINGGEHRESNLQPLCFACHKAKTKEDVAEKSKVARVAKKHLGMGKAKRTIPGRRFNGEPIPSRVR